MGLLFNKKLSDGNIVSRKIVSDSDIDKKDVRDISRKLGFTRTGARQKFEEILNKSQSGGITRDEIHSGLQELISQEKITEEQAMRMARELGLEDKRFRYFKDVSEMQAGHKDLDSQRDLEYKKIKDRELKAKLDKSASPDKKIINTAPGQRSSDKPDLTRDSPAIRTKPASIWNILNKSKD